MKFELNFDLKVLSDDDLDQLFWLVLQERDLRLKIKILNKEFPEPTEEELNSGTEPQCVLAYYKRMVKQNDHFSLITARKVIEMKLMQRG